MTRTWTVVGVALLAWAGAVIVAVTVSTEAGIMSAMPSAVTVAVTLIRQGQISARRAFIHGWHAGYHEATHSNCVPVQDADCAVYLLSERKWTSA